MLRPTVNTVLWAGTGLLLAARLLAISCLPLTGDEAYYWEWSQRLAFGYVDHPPAVAWVIAACAGLGKAVWVIRFGFWLCGCVATFALADAARRLAPLWLGDAARSAALAALFLSVAPIASVALATASPDGPFLAAWALAIDLGIALCLGAPRSTGMLLGAACGCAILSRAFGWALLLGVVLSLKRRPWVLALTMVTTSLFAAPYLLWNAQHQWVNLGFTLVGRHVNEGASLMRPLLMLLEIVGAFGITSAVVVICMPFAIWKSLGKAAAGKHEGALSDPHEQQRQATMLLLLWTAFPLLLVFLLLSCFERVEVYWALGPFLSLFVATAVWVSLQRISLWITFLPAFSLTAVLLSLAIAPFAFVHFLTSDLHVSLALRRPGPLEIYTYRPLARDIQHYLQQSPGIAITDGYGFSSLLDYEAGIPPVVIGYDTQGSESRRWRLPDLSSQRALFIDKESLQGRPDFAQQLARACTHVIPGPTFQYALPSGAPRIYWTTWCTGMHANAIALLRWERL